MTFNRTVHPWVAEARHRVRFAVVGAFLREWPRRLEFVQRAEALGFDAFWANDHPNRSGPVHDRCPGCRHTGDRRQRPRRYLCRQR